MCGTRKTLSGEATFLTLDFCRILTGGGEAGEGGDLKLRRGIYNPRHSKYKASHRPKTSSRLQNQRCRPSPVVRVKTSVNVVAEAR